MALLDLLFNKLDDLLHESVILGGQPGEIQG